jgi:hypothetical protein
MIEYTFFQRMVRAVLLGLSLGLVLLWTAVAGTEPISVDTGTGVVKKTSSGAGEAGKPFNWRSVEVSRLPHAVTFYVDGSGSTLTTGTKNPIKIPYGGTLKGWTLVAKPSGSVTVDIYRSINNAGLPSVSIIGLTGTKPALASSVENSSTSFTNWTSTTLNEKDTLAINLSAVTGVTYCALTLYFQ